MTEGEKIVRRYAGALRKNWSAGVHKLARAIDRAIERANTRGIEQGAKIGMGQEIKWGKLDYETETD